LADALLFMIADQKILPGASDRGMLAYYRFRDDIFLVSDGFESAHTFFWSLKENSLGVFRMEVVQLSKVTVDMLAVTIRKEGGHLLTCPREKADGPVLSQQSAHPWHVRAAWPQAVLRAQLRLCSKATLHAKVVQQYIKRFSASHMPLSVLESLAEVKADRGTNRQCAYACSWLVLGFHPLWQRIPFKQIFRAVEEDPMWSSAIATAFEGLYKPHIAVAWRNAAPNLYRRAQRITRGGWTG